MRINIENAARCAFTAKQAKWVLGELVKNLKELRDRTQNGDLSALDEFFDLYRFNDNERADRNVVPLAQALNAAKRLDAVLTEFVTGDPVTGISIMTSAQNQEMAEMLAAALNDFRQSSKGVAGGAR